VVMGECWRMRVSGQWPPQQTKLQEAPGNWKPLVEDEIVWGKLGHGESWLVLRGSAPTVREAPYRPLHVELQRIIQRDCLEILSPQFKCEQVGARRGLRQAPTPTQGAYLGRYLVEQSWPASRVERVLLPFFTFAACHPSHRGQA
jgi:hypothetical protein